MSLSENLICRLLRVIQCAKAAVTLGAHLYLLGGMYDPCSVPSCRGQLQIYEPASDTWAVGPALPWDAEGSVSAAIVDGTILACGGLFDPARNREGSNPTDCFAYDPANSRWTRRASMLQGVDHAACAALERTM